MIITLIAAIDEAGGIGKDGRVPWHLTDDLKNFKRLTMGHYLLMGRKTYETVAGKLAGRKLIVLTRDEEFEIHQADEALVAHSLEAGVTLAEEAGEGELFVIGGAEIYAQTLPLAQRFYRTRVATKVEADTWFPEYDESDWQPVESQDFEQGGKNDWAFTIEILERIST